MRQIDVEMFRDAHRANVAFQIFRGPIMLLLEKKLAIHFVHDAIQDGRTDFLKLTSTVLLSSGSII